jgi:hypothetical protein
MAKHIQRHKRCKQMRGRQFDNTDDAGTALVERKGRLLKFAYQIGRQSEVKENLA